MSTRPDGPLRPYLFTVTSEVGREIHLALRARTGVRDRFTLCGLPAAGPQAAGAFLDLGCHDCALLADDSGLRVAGDDEGAAVSIEAFLRRHPERR
ncbi:hypothetical protein [Nocardioides caldifontis]|uniref:hypothetical protein n=1 Tax=Nocardioides caldifontis TaxID=2588938 RepID=UPI0011DF15A7|nr:hypothetical protein [Nocardioides caldifontis]